MKNFLNTRALLGRMTTAERQAGRFLRGPEEHPNAPPAPVVIDEPAPLVLENIEEVVVPPVVEEVVPPVAPPVVDDEKARLLKDTMKNKAARIAAEAAAAEATAALAAFEGVTPAEVAQYRADKAAADLAAAEARGDYDRIVASMREQSDAREAAAATAAEAREAALAAAQARIDDLTNGRAFGDSKFLSTQTILSPSKARRLYGDHFETEEGAFVAYDKPAGAKNRTRLVDARGDDLDFEAAIEKIVKADPDFDTIARSNLLPGSGSTPAPVAKNDPKPTVKAGTSRIAAALAKLQEAK